MDDDILHKHKIIYETKHAIYKDLVRKERGQISIVLDELLDTDIAGQTPPLETRGGGGADQRRNRDSIT